MPKALERKRGGVIRYRTIKLPGDKYAHIGVTRKAGPRGGRTIMGRVHKKKKESHNPSGWTKIRLDNQ